MFTPLHSSERSSDRSSKNATTDVLTLASAGRLVSVVHDGFSIGASPRCDLVVSEHSVPPLHSVVHLQGGAIWIQTADDTTMLFVNDQPCRRMALRHQDRLRIGSTEFTVLMVPEIALAVDENAMTEDLALLTAEELCDRILSEQTMVEQFEEGQRTGWDALLRAIDATNEESVAEDVAAIADEQQAAFDALLNQIHDLNETITDRARELTTHEAEVMSSASMLDETQQRVSQRLGEILDQLNKTDPPNELRASA
jgi:hypothetical protein